MKIAKIQDCNGKIMECYYDETRELFYLSAITKSGLDYAGYKVLDIKESEGKLMTNYDKYRNDPEEAFRQQVAFCKKYITNNCRSSDCPLANNKPEIPCGMKWLYSECSIGRVKD